MIAYSASELAAMRLPGLPSKAHKIRLRAKREAWPFSSRTGRGGPERAYPATALPARTQAALARLHHAPSDPLSGITAQLRGIAEERLRIVRAALCLIESGVKPSEAYAAAALDTPHSSRSVQRWTLTCRHLPSEQHLLALVPRWCNASGFAECHPDAWAHFKSDYLRASKPAASACYRRLLTVAKAQNWQPIPSLHALRRRLQSEVDHTVIIAAREGDEAVARLYPAQERDKSHLSAMHSVNSDGHRFDVMVRWPDGEVSRPVLVGFQDLYSGRILSHRIDKTEHGDLVRLAFGDMVEHHGIPEHCYLDNGRGFANKWFTGRAAWRFRFKVLPDDPAGVVTQLGVAVHWTTPYHGQAKPIERAWRDLCEDIARHPTCEGAYTGSDTTSKPHNYGSRAVELEEFTQLVQVCINEHNARTGRRSKVCAGRSFDEAFSVSLESTTVQRITEEQRRLLFLAAESVRVRRETGEVHLLGNRYWSPELAQRCGAKVVLRFDPQAVKRGVYVYAPEGDYIAFAECIEAVGFDDRSQARAHARKRAAWTKAQKRALAAERVMTAEELGDMHLQATAAAPPKATQAKVVRMKPDLPKVKPTAQESARQERDDDFVLQVGRLALTNLPRRRAGNE